VRADDDAAPNERDVFKTWWVLLAGKSAKTPMGTSA
jgi:hypothetical protein